MKTNQIIQGDCIEEMKKLPENSVDAIITDPPYGLEFMGKEWDKFKEGKNIAGGTTGEGTPFGRSKPLNSVYQYNLEQKYTMQKFFQEWAKECLRVLKSGGFLLSFGGTRTYYRMVCGIEDAGFEIRDTIMWLYGSGFPKSLNIGKQIDKLQGNEREEYIDNDFLKRNPKANDDGVYKSGLKDGEEASIRTKGSSEWEGWGTALKPAYEPIVVARKPLSEKTVALNVLKWGTGGINIDICRIGTDKSDKNWRVNPSVRNKETEKHLYGDYGEHNTYNLKEQGRFPANIILDEEAGRMLDEQSGISSSKQSLMKGGKQDTIAYGDYNKIETIRGHNDKGGASRFFYCAKASKSERNFGCEEMEQKDMRYEDNRSNSMEIFSNQYTESSGNPTGRGIVSKKANNHPTVKPIALMEYLIKLVTKPEAIILDPFLGSGTTAIACLKLNRKFIGIEKEEEHIKIANARIKPYLEQEKLK